MADANSNATPSWASFTDNSAVDGITAHLQPEGTVVTYTAPGSTVTKTYRLKKQAELVANGVEMVEPNEVKPLAFQWKHYANSEHRIDPSRTNVNDIFVLSAEYDYLTRLWIRNGANPDQIPAPPSELDLRLAFEEFEDYRIFSDQIVWRPVKYKFLFGNGAADQLRAQFKVVKLPNSNLSDGEIQAQVIRAVNSYFDVNLWDFGETFYYTELAAYIHQQLASVISSVVLVPIFENANFGDGFEVRCRSDEIFISTAQVADVLIINSNTAANLRIR